MTDDLTRYRKALEKIARWDASRAKGYLDEWQEAAAFYACKAIAEEALDPELRGRRIAERNAQIAANLAGIRALNKGTRYWLVTHGFSGPGEWVTFIKGDPNRAHDGIVVVRRDKWTGLGTAYYGNLRFHGPGQPGQTRP